MGCHWDTGKKHCLLPWTLHPDSSHLPQKKGEETLQLPGPRQSSTVPGGVGDTSPLSGPKDQLPLEEGQKTAFPPIHLQIPEGDGLSLGRGAGAQRNPHPGALGWSWRTEEIPPPRALASH